MFSGSVSHEETPPPRRTQHTALQQHSTLGLLTPTHQHSSTLVVVSFSLLLLLMVRSFVGLAPCAGPGFWNLPFLSHGGNYWFNCQLPSSFYPPPSPLPGGVIFGIWPPGCSVDNLEHVVRVVLVREFESRLTKSRTGIYSIPSSGERLFRE